MQLHRRQAVAGEPIAGGVEYLVNMFRYVSEK